jgi:tight adherence protein B
MRSGVTPKALLALVVASAALVLAGGSGAASDQLRLRPAAGVSYPDRAYVLTLPMESYIESSSVKVRENGIVMKDVSVVPATTAGTGQFGYVLVIDASESMRGSAIEGAVAAARAFAAHRTGSQVVGIVVFNRTTSIALPITSDSAAITRALEKAPVLGNGTHIYDAVVRAVEMLQTAKIVAGSVVLLSDGADTGSNESLDGAVKVATDAHFRVYTVGLRSAAFKAGPLEELARRGGGEYAEAQTPEDLEPIFDSLGARLTDEYLLRYRSDQPPNRKVVVAVTVKGFAGAATAGYTVPADAANPEAPFNRGALERFVRSATGMMLTAFAAAALVGCALMLLIQPRRKGVTRKLAEFVSLPIFEDTPRKQAEKDLPFDRAERTLEGTGWWARFRRDLDVGRITIAPMQIVFWTLAATVVVVYVVSLAVGPLFGVVGLSIPFLVRGLIQRRVSQQQQLFASQLPDNLQVLASALRAGHSLVGALSVVVEDSPEPSRREFQRVIADEQLGVPLEDAIEAVAERMDSSDLRQVGLVAALQHETGGNTAEVLDRVADTVRERFELRRLVRTLTTQGRLSRWILTGLPILLLVVITFLNPEYVDPLYTRQGGRILLIVAAVMVTSGSLVIRKIINIRV